MFRPMLAETADLEKLKFPLIAQPKFDGIRCIVLPDVGPVTRTLKPIPNHYIRQMLEQYTHFDGEIVTYTTGVIDPLNVVQSKVLSAEGMPDFTFHAFDHIADVDAPYEERQSNLIPDGDRVRMVRSEVMSSLDALMMYEDRLVSQGWEGAILRAPGSRYKFGRSTVREGILLKMKRFSDAEATVIGIVEKMTNANTLGCDERGYAKRSSAKSGLVPAGTTGALKVDWDGTQFDVGTGFDDALRLAIWEAPSRYIGKNVTFKYQRVGPNGKPLLPVFKAFRDARDHEDLI